MRSPNARAWDRAPCIGTIRRGRRSILAVYQHDVRRLVDSVAEVLAAQPPLEALQSWFHTLADYVRVKHGLGDALQTAAVKDAINATYAPVVNAVATLLDACVADGSVRDGLDPDDVLLLMGFLWRVPDGPAGRATGAPDDGHRNQRDAGRRNHLSSLDIRRSARTLPPV